MLMVIFGLLLHLVVRCIHHLSLSLDGLGFVRVGHPAHASHLKFLLYLADLKLLEVLNFLLGQSAHLIELLTAVVIFVKVFCKEVLV